MDPVQWSFCLEKVYQEAHAILQTDPRSYRGKALVRAVQLLRQRPVPTVWDDLRGLPGVGDGTRTRLQQCYQEVRPTTPLFAPPPPVESDPLSDIYGLGPQRLKELAKVGVRTSQDLLRHLETHPEAAPEATHVYLRHRGDLRERIPLEESRAFEQSLKTALARFPRLRWEMAGSYRRGAVTQGDWDVVCAHPDPETALQKVVARLSARGLELVTFGEGPRKWEGIVRGPSGRFRRLDLRMVAPDSYAPALLYFTGSKEHNIRLRQVAKRKGWRLNEYALLSKDGKAMEAPDEKAIFRLLGVPYVPPMQRF